MSDWELVLLTITRVAHVGTAIALVGGSIFMRFVLMPAAQLALPDADHQRLREQVIAIWKRFVHRGIAIILISGTINFVRAIIAMRVTGRDPLYHGIMGVKILLAFAVFFIASALVGKSAAFAGIRANSKKWITISIALSLVIVAMSGFLRVRSAGKASGQPAVITPADPVIAN